jgi:CheY-like chemotaxis protein
LVRDILLEHGYEVLAAADGDEALMLCERHGKPIHLMVTDVVMPRMSGRQLAERLSQLHPEVKVLYISGYTDSAIVHHGVLDAGMAFLNKPFNPDVLLRKIREVLSPAAD